MKKRWILAGAALAIVVALVALAAPIAPAAYEAPIPAEERARNAAILTALAAIGIERAWVDAGADSILVVYELPEGIPLDTAQAYAIGAAAIVAPDSEAIAARTTEGIEWRARTGDVLAYQAGEMTRDELEARVERSTSVGSDRP